MKRIISALIIFFSVTAYSQYYSGEIGFGYLSIPVSPLSQSFSTAGAAALERAGDLINPASLYFYTDGNEATMNYMNYIAGSHFGMFSYTNSGSQVLLKYFNSGLIEKRDSLNTDLGTYSANVIILNYSKAFLFKEKFIFGAGVNLGVENITEYNGIEGSFDLGFIYKNIYSDFLNIGVNATNLGVLYDFESSSAAPAKIVAGVSISKEDMPFAVYIDVGKIIDRKIFYAAGMEFFLIRPQTAVQSENADITSVTSSALSDIEVDIKLDSLDNAEVSDTAIDLSENEISLENRSDTLIQADTLAILQDTLKTENGTDENEYTSYADFLEDEEKKIESSVEENKEIVKTQNEAETLPEETLLSPKIESKNNILNPLAFSVIWGFSSDRQELSMGYGTDLLAGFTAGFRMSYKMASVNYSVKMWGELELSQSLGLGFRF